MAANTVDPELDALKREFLTEAQEKVREIEGLLDGDSLDRVAYIAHQLKGSGGSYGYARISAEAAEIEHAVETSDHGSAHDRIRDHVSRLREEIDRRSGELSA
ncbi:MAG TPA: Hpt domain-containing protein [Thermoanaerobaculia bacterium]|nr:Hpt domain-containing protein [Thermoanaerobaculia bacterium]